MVGDALISAYLHLRLHHHIVILIYNSKITNNIRLQHKFVNIYAEAEEQFVNKITSQTDF